MEILNDFQTSVFRALHEIDPQYDLYNGLVVCGTHNQKNIDEILEKIKYARENERPALLICAGHQLAWIEYCRNVLGIADATSEEFGVAGTAVVKKRPELKVGLHEGESWWSNYECIDLPTHIWDKPAHFISVPFHPEYQSSKEKPHPLLVKFLKLCKK